MPAGNTDLPPLAYAVVLLEEALVVRNAIFAVDESEGICQSGTMADWVYRSWLFNWALGLSSMTSGWRRN